MKDERHDTEAERRERVLQQLVREYRERHRLCGLSEVVRVQGQPGFRERAVREFAEHLAVGK